MKAKSVLEEMDVLEKTVGFGPWERWNRLRHLIEQACAVEELEAAQPAGEAVAKPLECICLRSPHPGCPIHGSAARH